ncbi:MAG: TRAP transporter TatT component family protein [Proteobacteria bacterium]|nr:TRAP transporter TatT component family protein [Pseudomonadota bacterium]
MIKMRYGIPPQIKPLALLNRAFSYMVIPMVLVCFSACSMKVQMVRSMVPLMDDMNAAVNMNTDIEMVRDAFPFVLIQLDGFITVDPNEDMLLNACEAYSGYSFAFVEDVDNKRAGRLYSKAREYGIQALKHNGFFAENYKRTDLEFSELLAGFSRRDVPALYLTANAWMGWISLNLDDPETFMDIPKVVAMLNKIIELDETYYYGSAHVLLGTYYSVPKAVGGNPEKARYHFNRAFEISDNKMLIFHYLYAKYYATQSLDKALFTQMLDKVMSSPDTIFPEMGFVNALAKWKAGNLYQKADEFF